MALKEGDKVKLKRYAESTYRRYFNSKQIYTIRATARGGALCVYTQENGVDTALYGCTLERNFELASSIRIGGE